MSTDYINIFNMTGKLPTLNAPKTIKCKPDSIAVNKRKAAKKARKVLQKKRGKGKK